MISVMMYNFYQTVEVHEDRPVSLNIIVLLCIMCVCMCMFMYIVYVREHCQCKQDMTSLACSSLTDARFPLI